jgi:nicotinamidase-related amidase
VSLLDLTVRHYRHGTDDRIECREENTRHADREWSLPARETALVLVDCWAEHFIRSHEETSGRIIRERLMPAVEASRRAKVVVIHAPSPAYAHAYSQWHPDVPADGPSSSAPAGPGPGEWPPAAFRRREGEYAPFARPAESKITEWVKEPSRYRIAEELGPVPGDFVVATGEQLHRLLGQRKILHLVYAGFATNLCVLFRDYGTRAMAARGYNVLLLRDGTAGIESHETVGGQWLTRAAVHSIELSTGHSTTCEAFIRACRAASEPASAASE